jgi:hypothetical protein
MNLGMKFPTPELLEGYIQTITVCFSILKLIAIYAWLWFFHLLLTPVSQILLVFSFIPLTGASGKAAVHPSTH